MSSNKYSSGAAKMAGDPRFPSGCLMVQGALAVGNAARSVQKEAVGRRAASEIALRRRLQQRLILNPFGGRLWLVRSQSG